MVLDRFGSSSGVGEGDGATTAVDTRLVLDASINGWSRDRLLGLRLLFEWADRRALPDFALSFSPAQLDSQVNSGKINRRDKGKGKKVDTKRSKKKVSVEASSTEASLASAKSQGDNVGGGDTPSGWWIRDSVIEELKGKTWLAGG